MDEGSPSYGGQVLGATWRPKELAFGPYLAQKEAKALRVVVRKPVSDFVDFFLCFGWLIDYLQLKCLWVFACFLKYERFGNLKCHSP